MAEPVVHLGLSPPQATALRETLLRVFVLARACEDPRSLFGNQPGHTRRGARGVLCQLDLAMFGEPHRYHFDSAPRPG